MCEKRKIWLFIVWATGMLVVIELALQVRAHVRYGTSIFNVLSSQTTYEFNEVFQLKLLRPNSTIQGTQAIIESNALGLRSPDLPIQKQANELRVAILGASTVMGAYTRSNEEVLSYRLEKYLRKRFPQYRVHVINAGIAGYGLDKQRRMLERVIAPFGLDLLIWYPGFNDVSGYCRNQKRESVRISHGLPKLQLPNWLLSIELITKNTVWLRSARAGEKDVVDPLSLDLTAYHKRVDAVLESAAKMEVPVIAMTMAKAYCQHMPLEEQMRLSVTARYYNHCFDLAGLYQLFEQHNDLIANASLARGYPVIRLGNIMPGGDEYFGDSTHFSPTGTDYVARLLAQEIVSLEMLPTESGVAEWREAQ